MLTVKTKRKTDDRHRAVSHDSMAWEVFRVKNYHIKSDGSMFYISQKFKHGSLAELVKMYSESNRHNIRYYVMHCIISSWSDLLKLKMPKM